MKFACNDKSHFANVLLKFVQSNELKILLDNKGELIELYKREIGINEYFSMILDLLNPSCIEKGDSVFNDNLTEFLINLTNSVFNQNKIIAVDEKRHFIGKESDLSQNSIELLDKEEMYYRLNNIQNVHVYNVSTNGNRSQVQIGNNNS